MFKLIEFLKKRPSDAAIRVLRAFTSLGLAGLLILENGKFTLLGQSYYEAYATWVVYGLAGLFIIHAIVFGILGLCVSKRSVIKKLQMATGVICIIIGASITYPSTAATGADSTNGNSANSTSGSININDLAAAPAKKPAPIGGWFIFYGLFTLLAGITGKMVTQSCLKYGEVITKIRV